MAAIPATQSLSKRPLSAAIASSREAAYASSEAAMKAGLELKKKYPIQIRVYDAKERTRRLVELPE
jgi:hypothetical protein